MKLAVVSVLAAVPAIVAAPTPEINSESSTNPARREAHAPVRRETVPVRSSRTDFEVIEFLSEPESEVEEEPVVTQPTTGGRGGRGGARGGGRGRGGRGGRGRGGHGGGPRREGSPRRGPDSEVDAGDTPTRTPDRTKTIIKTVGKREVVEH
ncbi:hypothetical protein FLONG3_7023 [Fusarium longipes]|uniref:Uncharacterized protein n=1 Tax=Fusarium longipes TaxID=694270 RepID=A0A395SI28_9HYPO|nr:hypothetical protein FLONG3_7023 [Fusarium longipes]